MSSSGGSDSGSDPYGSADPAAPGGFGSTGATATSFADATDAGADANASGAAYELNEENQWGWITLYVVTIVIAILGNLLFVIASLCTKRTRTTGV